MTRDKLHRDMNFKNPLKDKRIFARQCKGSLLGLKIKK